jgi:hypothetical protein
VSLRDAARMPFDVLVRDLVASKPTDVTAIMNLFPHFSCERAAFGMLEFRLMKGEQMDANDVLFYGLSWGAKILRRDCESFLNANFYADQSIPRLIIADERQLEAVRGKPIPNPMRLSEIHDGVSTARRFYDMLPSQHNVAMIDCGLYAGAKLKQAFDFTPIEPLETKGYLRIMLDRAGGLCRYAMSFYPKGSMSDVLSRLPENDDRVVIRAGEDGTHNLSSWVQYLKALAERKETGFCYS